MGRRLLVDLICEDAAHETLLRPLIDRFASGIGARVEVRVLSARGGIPWVKKAVETWTNTVESGSRRLPDVLVVGVDANCKGHRHAESEIQKRVGGERASLLVPACPDPHIEKWYIAEQEAFVRVVGGRRHPIPKKCERDLYKRLLRDWVREAGHAAPFGGIEFGPELVGEIDLYQLGKDEPSFGSFARSMQLRLKGGSM